MTTQVGLRFTADQTYLRGPRMVGGGSQSVTHRWAVTSASNFLIAAILARHTGLGTPAASATWVMVTQAAEPTLNHFGPEHCLLGAGLPVPSLNVACFQLDCQEVKWFQKARKPITSTETTRVTGHRGQDIISRKPNNRFQNDGLIINVEWIDVHISSIKRKFSQCRNYFKKVCR